MKRLFQAAWIATFPVMIGYISVGMAFGLLFQKTGIPFYWALLMSIFVYAGSMQFVAISLLTTRTGYLDTLLMTLFVNFRHLFYGLSLIEPFSRMGWIKPYMIFSLTDETYSLHIASPVPQDIDPTRFHFTISAMNQSYWIIGTLLGGLLGTVLSIPLRGLDFIMTALFTVLLTEQWLLTKNPLPIIVGFVSSLAAIAAFGPSHMIIPATFLIVIFLLLMKGRIAKNLDHDQEERTHE